MPRTDGPPLALRLYIWFLGGAAIVVLVYSVMSGRGLWSDVPGWLLLTSLLALSEYTDLSFHFRGQRVGLSAAEAILLPLLVGFSFSEAVWAPVLGMTVVQLLRHRDEPLKATFNIAEYCVAAAAAAGVFDALAGPGREFTVRVGAVGVFAVLTFAVVTHALTLLAVSLAQQQPLRALGLMVAPTALWNSAGNMILGLMFAASYVSAPWTVFVFPLPMFALYLGYRGVLAQSGERERVEALHAASRALAGSRRLEEALLGFLSAVREIVSASQTHAIIRLKQKWVTLAIDSRGTLKGMEEIARGEQPAILNAFANEPSHMILSRQSEDPTGLLDALDAQNILATPLMDADVLVGILIATDRLGAEEFGDADGRLLGAVGNELVLTLDSYRLFEQVAEERERFQKIFAGSKEGICLLDEEGSIRAWNPALARITGFEEEGILGEKWSERVLVRDRNHRRIEGMDIVRVPPDEELELVTRQGPPRWVAIMSGEVQTGDDEKSWVLLVRDITAEHELEESKSDFLSTISHELRTPLTTIKGSLQVLSRPTASANTEIGKQMIEIMKRGSDRLERLVMNLLAVSQMETGDVQVFPDEVELEELVRSRIVTILPDHPQVDLQVEQDVVARADKERLAQAVEHLLENARKFGPESGTIRIEIAKENGYARISVTDDGPGIPKVDQERIFERFVRLGNVLTRETQGPGVGLFIVKRSIEAMSGSVEVESDPNRGGSTFHVRIPLAHPMAAAEPTSA